MAKVFFLVLLDSFFVCFFIFSLLWLDLFFGTQGRPRKVKFFYKQESDRRQETVYPQKNPTESCSVKPLLQQSASGALSEDCPEDACSKKTWEATWDLDPTRDSLGPITATGRGRGIKTPAFLLLTWMTLQGEYKKKCSRMNNSKFRVGGIGCGS